MRRKEREITEKELIEEIISSADVCRIAFADGDTPYIVTMNFGYSGGEKQGIYFHCAPEGRKIEMMKKNSHVCFQMDTGHLLTNGARGCDWGMKYKSVVGYGRLSVVENDEKRKEGLNLIMRHYGGSVKYDYDQKIFARTTILYLEITEISAKEA